MEYIKAETENTDQITELVQNTIRNIYPRYYPKEIVDFFCDLHSKENIAKDIESGLVGILKQDNVLLGTGCHINNHITRVYVDPAYQRQGYGSYIMQCLENEIGSNYDSVHLDSSLPASHLYEQREYKTLQHERLDLKNGVTLVYEVMEKTLANNSSAICYDGKNFLSQANTENGEVDGDTLFAYHQKNNMVWADYSGGQIVKGHLLGTVAENGELDFYYQHINVNEEIRVGICHSVPCVLENGKLKLEEKWQWLNGDKSEGESIICEK